MAYNYDTSNVFAKILSGELPCKEVLSTKHSLAFHDIQPQAPKHILVIPKGAYVNFDHFSSTASDEEIIDFVRAVGRVAEEAGITPAKGDGYRLIANAGTDAIQEVDHMHVHVFGGRTLGRILQPANS